MIPVGTHVRVLWWDACTHPSGWIDEKDAIEWAETVKSLAESEGRVLEHNKNYLLISCHSLDGMVAEATRIPQCCIYEAVRLYKEGEHGTPQPSS